MPLYKYIISLFVVFALLSKVGFAANIPQHKSPDASQHFVCHFRFDRAVLDSGYMDNRLSLRGLDRMLIDKSAEVDSVVIIASGSPEGVVEYNQALAARRAKAVKGYLIWKYPHINQYKIFTHSIGEDWVGLRRLVEADDNAPHKEQILKVLAQDVNPSTKEWRLKQIGGDNTFYTINVPFSSQDGNGTEIWNMRNKITYTLLIDGSMAGLEPIEFTTDVENWADTTGGSIDL